MTSPAAPRRASCARRPTRALGALAAASAVTLSSCGLFGADSSEPERNAEGQVTEAVEDGDVFALQVGDCLGDTGTGEVAEVAIQPCDEPHDSEAFHAFEVEGEEFPGTEAMAAEAAQCQEEFEAFVGRPVDESTLEINYYAPTQQSWDEADDREILCLVYDPAGPTTGSLEGSAK